MKVLTAEGRFEAMGVGEFGDTVILDNGKEVSKLELCFVDERVPLENIYKLLKKGDMVKIHGHINRAMFHSITPGNPDRVHFLNNERSNDPEYLEDGYSRDFCIPYNLNILISLL